MALFFYKEKNKDIRAAAYLLSLIHIQMCIRDSRGNETCEKRRKFDMFALQTKTY